jgi:hypothetical protein
MDPNGLNLIPTFEAASALGLRRPQFLVLARFLGVKPSKQARLTSRSRTPGNLYSPDEIALLKALEAHCQVSGTRAVLKHLLESQE